MSKQDDHPYADIANVEASVGAVVADLKAQVLGLIDFSKAHALLAELGAEVNAQSDA